MRYLFNNLRDCWYKFLRLLNIQRHDVVYTELPRFEYSDECERILYSCMSLLCEFIESGEYDIVDWMAFSNYQEASKELLKAYIWWRYDRIEEDDIVDQWWNNEISLDETDRLFNWIFEKDQQALYSIIKYRQYICA